MLSDLRKNKVDIMAAFVKTLPSSTFVHFFVFFTFV